jgi:predicted dehydrogenase
MALYNSDMSVKVGIIGCGVIGLEHLTHFTQYPPVELIAIADQVADRRATVAEDFAPRRIYETGKDLIEDSDVEAVVLAVPAEPRLDLAKQAIAAGKHVLLEKPVARNTAEVDEYLKLVQPGQIVAVASSRFRFTYTAAALRDALQTPGLLPIRQIIHTGTKPIPEPPSTPPPPWRLSHRQNGGGIMSNWGCYDLDYLLALLPSGDMPVEVSASIRDIQPEIEAWVAPGSDAETFVSVMIRLSSGATIHLNRGEFLPIAEARNETLVLGSSAAISAAMVSEQDTVTVTRYSTTGSESTEVTNKRDGFDNFHTGMIRDFVDAVRDGREPATNLHRARIIQSITDAIYRSAKEQRSIQL